VCYASEEEALSRRAFHQLPAHTSTELDSQIMQQQKQNTENDSARFENSAFQHQVEHRNNL
jgi:hypothetical protein